MIKAGDDLAALIGRGLDATGFRLKKEEIIVAGFNPLLYEKFSCDLPPSATGFGSGGPKELTMM